jgi:hypothetical protein
LSSAHLPELPVLGGPEVTILRDAQVRGGQGARPTRLLLPQTQQPEVHL